MGTMPRGEGRDHQPKESRRQETVVIAITTADFPKIIAWPIEFVALCNNDPGPLVVKSEMTFDRGGNFNCGRWIGRRSMRDWENHNDRRVVLRALDRQHDHAWTIFTPFFPLRFMLMVPQIGVGNHKARLGRGYWHACAL